MINVKLSRENGINEVEVGGTMAEIFAELSALLSLTYNMIREKNPLQGAIYKKTVMHMLQDKEYLDMVFSPLNDEGKEKEQKSQRAEILDDIIKILKEELGIKDED